MGHRIVRAEAQQSTCQDLLTLRRQLAHKSVNCDTYASLFRLYGEHRALSDGHLLHARVILDGVHPHELSFLQNLLVQMYGRCGAMADAFSTFFHIHQTDHFSYNLLLGACSESACFAEAIHVFNQMQTEGFLPTKHAFHSLLAIYASRNSIWACKATHAQINASGSAADVVLESAIVNMYGKCRSVKDARKMFDRMLQKNVFSYNAMMTAYAQLGQSTDALLFYQEMLMNGVAPSKVTFVCLLDACTSLASSDMTKVLQFGVIYGGFDSDIVVGTALINLYGKHGYLEEAVHMFNKLPSKGVVTWNMMIDLSASYGQGQDAFSLFREMLEVGVIPNSRTFVGMLSACANLKYLADGKVIHFSIVSSGIFCDLVLETALVTMYGKCGSYEDAQVVYGNMCMCDAAAWTTMMAAYIQHRQGRKVLLLIQKIPPGASFDSYTILNILEICATEGALEVGRLLHALCLDIALVLEMSVGTAVVSMYSKCGKLEDAQSSFQIISQPDVVAWNAMTAAYAQHGQFEAVTNILRRMLWQGVVPDEVSIKCLLTALSHVGMVDTFLYLLPMEFCFGILPAVDHYNILLDLFGRAGWLDEGKRLILNMPFQPGATSWMTLLTACRTHLDVLGGERAASHAYEIEPNFGAPYIVLANVYMASNQLDNLS
ncbi:hypothetical protein L7F22_063891 [Adiantum nelumboides]|nr:hypothetical protein [Adiantum nelumboides]